MSTVVIMPGGFHPFHAGHLALYNSAKQTFPGAEVYVAATNDTSTRPFPFAIKEKLARLAGVDPAHFFQVRSPFKADEITKKYNPKKDRLIFVRSEKDADKPPQPGGIKKDGSPSYLQPLAGQTNIRPFGEHAYMAYLPTVEFGPGMTSATEIRTAWPRLSKKRRTALVMSLYPATQKNPALAANIVKMLDAAIGSDLTESGMLGHVMFRSKPPKLKKIQPAASRTKDFMKKDFSLNEFVGNEKDFRGKPDIKARYQHGQDFVVSVNGDQYSFAVTNMEAQGENPVLFNIANHIMMDINGDQAPQDIQQAVANYIDEYHQRDLAKVSAFHDKKYAQHPDYYHTTYQKPLQRVSDFVKKDPDQDMAENQGWAATFTNEETGQMAGTPASTGMWAGYQRRENQPVDEDYIEEKWSQKYKNSINCSNPKGFSQRAHCAGRKK